MRGKTRHGYDRTRKDNEITCACRDIAVSYRKREAFGIAELLRIIGKRILCLCDADRKIAVALLNEFVDLGLSFREDVDLACARPLLQPW